MATKMANWIAYQERHLSPEAFAAWKASNVKVQSYLAKQDRVPAVCRNLDDFQKDIGKKVMLPAIQHASDWLATIEKTAAAADQDSGTLTQSIGSTKARILPGAYFLRLRRQRAETRLRGPCRSSPRNAARSGSGCPRSSR